MKGILGFLIGVVFTVCMLIFFPGLSPNGKSQPKTTDSEEVEVVEVVDNEEVVGQPRTNPNYTYFELNTKNGVITLHTEMTKDEVKALMGMPYTTEIDTYGSRVVEKWEYLGRNRSSILPEFTMKFENGKLKSVSQTRM